MRFIAWLIFVQLLCLLHRCDGLLVSGKSLQVRKQKARTNDDSQSISLKFKKGNNEGDNEGSAFGSIWRGIRRFLPSTSKARIKETYKTPQGDAGHRYHVRLLDVDVGKKRHVITRLRRFLPDLSWETAETIVTTAIDNGASLIRVFSSKDEASYLVEMLRKADPPISVEVYDAKLGETIIV